MKNIFDYNVGKKQYDGHVFQTGEVSGQIWKEWNILEDKVESVTTAYDGYIPFGILPLPMQILTFIGLFLCIPYVSIIIKYAFTDELTFAKAYANAPWAVILGIVAFAFTIPVVVITLILKKINSKRDYSDLFAKRNSVLEKICKELYIAEYTIEVDVLSVEYSCNGSQRKLCRGYKHRYKGTQWSCFFQDDALHFTDYQRIFSVSIDSIESVETVRKRIYMKNWTKHAQNYNVECFIPGYIKIVEYGVIHIKDSFEEYEILIPGYDWKMLKVAIDAYKKAIKIHIEGREEMQFYKSADSLYSCEDSWNENNCIFCLELKLINDEEIEKVTSHFLKVIKNMSAWEQRVKAAALEQVQSSIRQWENQEYALEAIDSTRLTKESLLESIQIISLVVTSDGNVRFECNICDVLDELFMDKYIKVEGSLYDDTLKAKIYDE